MKEIGSFIELDLRDTGEYYYNVDMLRLNTGRAAIFHACKLYGVSRLYMPYYQCPSVAVFLQKNGIEVDYYHIDENFVPQCSSNELNSALLIVNYFGVLSNDYISSFANRYNNVIVDNSPAFYSKPNTAYYNVYSMRKFFGVPDGAYIIGPGANSESEEYPLDASSDMSGFLLKRIEKGCSAVYDERMKNESRIEKAGVMKMSVLTQALLNNIDYEDIAKKRISNFKYIHGLFKSINKINPLNNFDEGCVPMVYPLVVKDSGIVQSLADKKIYTGRWWKHVLSLVDDDTFEAYMSSNMIPIPIDQRYENKDFDYIAKTVFEILEIN